jgi:hypothetical protein
MSAAKFPLRTKILVGVLAVIVVMWGVSWVQAKSLEKELEPFIGEHEKTAVVVGEESVAVITVAKRYVLFGDTTGKIEVFVRPVDDPEHIGGVEFNYVRENGSWQLTDSGSCASESCHRRGVKAFKARD